MRARARVTVTAVMTAVAVLAAGCVTETADEGGTDGGTGAGGAGEAPAGDGTLTMWSLENLDDRVAATEEILAGFTESTGIEVELVAVSEDQFEQLLTSAAAEGDLPDVIAALGLSGVQSLAVDGLLDTDAAAQVVDSLGEDTFTAASIELTSSDGAQLAVPSDAWPQLVLYRQDLFDEAGLAPPDSYDAMLEAATTLDGDDRSGIVAATTPGEVFTQQTFEHLALANDCQLVDDTGEVVLDSPACVETFEFVDRLLTAASPPGNQDVNSTRATYFAGQAAMVVWSSFILDELAGLRDDTLPSCPECVDDPGFLAANTGVVGAVTGPSGEGAQYGEVTSWAITVDADPAATQLVEYLMSEAYVDWLALAPEGKVPARRGTTAEPEAYLDAWTLLESGVDQRTPLSQVYTPEVIEDLVASTESISRWGLPQGEGELVGATLGELPVPEALSGMLNDTLTPPEAATTADEAATEIADSLE